MVVRFFLCCWFLALAGCLPACGVASCVFAPFFLIDKPRFTFLGVWFLGRIGSNRIGRLFVRSSSFVVVVRRGLGVRLFDRSARFSFVFVAHKQRVSGCGCGCREPASKDTHHAAEWPAGRTTRTLFRCCQTTSRTKRIWVCVRACVRVCVRAAVGWFLSVFVCACVDCAKCAFVLHAKLLGVRGVCVVCLWCWRGCRHYSSRRSLGRIGLILFDLNRSFVRVWAQLDGSAVAQQPQRDRVTKSRGASRRDGVAPGDDESGAERREAKVRWPRRRSTRK